MTSGRNAPCPCGSGKKYKKCCLKKEEQLARPAVSPLSGLLNDAVMPLMEHSRRIYGDVIFDVYDDHFGSQGHGFHDSPYLQVFVPWFLYFWTPLSELGRNWDPDQTIAARFLRERPTRAGKTLRTVIEIGRWAPFTFWQVTGVEEGSGLFLRDFLTGREVFASEVSASRTVKRWDILFGRVVQRERECVIDGMGPTVLEPALFREDVEGLAEDYRKIGKAGSEHLLEVSVALLSFYLGLVKRLRDRPAPRLQNTDGDALVFVTSTFVFDAASRGAVMMTLHGMRNIFPGGESEEAAEFVWEVKRRSGALDSVSKGRIFVGPNTLRVECNSNARARQIRKRIEKDLGHLLQHQETTREDVETASLRAGGSALEEDSGILDLQDLPSEARNPIESLLESTHMAWADERVPALDNHRPRDLVKFPEGRRKVAAMINDFENREARHPNPQYRFDYDKLRAELGLL